MTKKQNILSKIWCYFKDSWEGKDGKFSYRRFSQYIFLVCMIKCGFRPPSNQYEYGVFLIFAVLYALIASIITAQQMIELLKYKLPKDILAGGTDDNGGSKQEDTIAPKDD